MVAVINRWFSEVPLPPGGAGSNTRKRPLVVLFEHQTSGWTPATRALDGVVIPHELVRLGSVEPAGLVRAKLTATLAVPKVVLIDLQRPEVAQVELLRSLRSAPLTSLVPIVILADAASDDEVRLAYEAGVNSFLCKPEDDELKVETIAMVATYWLQLNLPPTTECP